MTSCHEPIFRINGPLWGIHQWFPWQRASNAELWCFFSKCAWTSSWTNNGVAVHYRRHGAHVTSLQLNDNTANGIIWMLSIPYFHMQICMYGHKLSPNDRDIPQLTHPFSTPEPYANMLQTLVSQDQLRLQDWLRTYPYNSLSIYRECRLMVRPHEGPFRSHWNKNVGIFNCTRGCQNDNAWCESTDEQVVTLMTFPFQWA